jgi:molecular chaperone GrpE
VSGGASSHKPDRHHDSPAEPLVRDRARGEGSRGNREVPPANDELLTVTRERDEYLDSLQRLKAEFDNYRKRAARDQESLVARAAESLVRELLPILDDLERALDAAERHEEAQLEEGVRLVHRSLAQALQKQGLEQIETNGRFDPHVHEALLSQPSDAEEGSVIDVLQKGYRLGDRVLRPARVIVSGAKEATPDGDADR